MQGTGSHRVSNHRAGRKLQLSDFAVDAFVDFPGHTASIDPSLLVAAYRSRPNVDADSIEDDALSVEKGGGVHGKRRDAMAQLARYAVPVLQREVRRLRLVASRTARTCEGRGECSTSPAGEVVSPLTPVTSSPTGEVEHNQCTLTELPAGCSRADSCVPEEGARSTQRSKTSTPERDSIRSRRPIRKAALARRGAYRCTRGADIVYGYK